MRAGKQKYESCQVVSPGDATRMTERRGLLPSWRSFVFASVVWIPLLVTACEETHGPSVPYTRGPTDGVWRGYVPNDAVSFGEWTPAPATPGAFDEYVFAITTPPALTTYDNGKTVTMTSTVSVRRVKDKGFNDGVSDQSFLFSPGAYAPENSQNEDYAEDTTVNCQKDHIAVGETTTCLVSFDAATSEIQDSYWDINQWSVGAWPSQRVP